MPVSFPDLMPASFQDFVPASVPDFVPASFQDFVPASVPDFLPSNPILTSLSTPPVYPPAIGFSTPLPFLGVITLSVNRKHHSLICQQMRNLSFACQNNKAQISCAPIGLLIAIVVCCQSCKTKSKFSAQTHLTLIKPNRSRATKGHLLNKMCPEA